MPVLCIPYEVTTTKDGTNSATEIRASCFPRNSASIQVWILLQSLQSVKFLEKEPVITISSILSMIIPLVSTKTGSGNS